MRKPIFLFISLFALLLASCSTGTPESVLGPEDIVTKLQKSDRLYVTEYVVHKLVTANDIKKVEASAFGKKLSIQTSVGDRKIAIPMDAVLKAYVDFDSLKVEDVTITQEPRSVKLVINAPKVELTSSKIDHKAITEFTGIFRTSFSTTEMSDFEKQGREAILASIPDMGIVNTAKQNAREILIPILMQSGFEADKIAIDFKN